MAQNTWVALATIQPSGSASSVVMNSIPSTYTDLVLVSNYPQDSAGSGRIFFNNDNSSGLYSQTVSYANAAGTTSGNREQNANFYYLMDFVSSSTTTSNMSITHIMSYARTDRFKTILETSGASDKGNVIGVGCWRNTNAITRIDFTPGGGSFTSGATITLYGIKNWGNEETPKASGGYIYSDSTYWYHAFPFSSTFTPNQSLSADILVVAGGGSGGAGQSGNHYGGGGGAGGLLEFSSQSLSATSYTVTVGAGGGTTTRQTQVRGNAGSNSQFSSLTASVGGGGGGSNNTTGGSGGSGGGGGGSLTTGVSGGAGTASQGYAGGNSGDAYEGAGGGGAGAVGGNGGTGAIAPAGGGDGGIGKTSSFINTIGAATGLGELYSGNYYFAGGGGAPDGGRGGNGGGGAGGDSGPVSLGAVSTGGGGGAGTAISEYSAGAAGGSGIVVVRYAKA